MATNLAECVLIGRVWPQLCPTSGMQLKVWLVCRHSHSGMQLKYPVYKRLCTINKCIIFFRSSASNLIVVTSKWQKF